MKFIQLVYILFVPSGFSYISFYIFALHFTKKIYSFLFIEGCEGEELLCLCGFARSARGVKYF